MVSPGYPSHGENAAVPRGALENPDGSSDSRLVKVYIKSCSNHAGASWLYKNVPRGSSTLERNGDAARAIASTPFTASSNAPGCQKLSVQATYILWTSATHLGDILNNHYLQLFAERFEYSSRYLPFSPDRTDPRTE